METAADALDGLDGDRLQPPGQARACASARRGSARAFALVWSLRTHLRQLQPAGVGSSPHQQPLAGGRGGRAGRPGAGADSRRALELARPKLDVLTTFYTS